MIASMAYLPRPWQGERRLGEDRAAEQQAEVQAEDGEDRRQRGAQPVLDHDRAFRQALGPGRADVVLAHRLQHAARVSRAYCAENRNASVIHGRSRSYAHCAGFSVNGA